MFLDVPEEFKPFILAQAIQTCEISRIGHFYEFLSTKNIFIDIDACALGGYGKDPRKAQSWGAGVSTSNVH